MANGAMQHGRSDEMTAQFERALELFRSGDVRLAHQAARRILERAPEHVGGMMLLLASAAATGDDLMICAALKSISGQYRRLLAIPEVRELFDGDLLAPVTATWTFRTTFAPALRAVQQLAGDSAGRMLACQVREAIRDAAVDAALLGAPAFRKAPAPRPGHTLSLVEKVSGTVIAAIQGGRACLVGRGDDAAVRLDHPSVSRRHLSLEVRDGAWFVQNLSATNGTLLNGHALGGGWAAVQEGDELRLGDVVLDVLGPGHSYALAHAILPALATSRGQTSSLPPFGPNRTITTPPLGRRRPDTGPRAAVKDGPGPPA